MPSRTREKSKAERLVEVNIVIIEQVLFQKMSVVKGASSKQRRNFKPKLLVFLALSSRCLP